MTSASDIRSLDPPPPICQALDQNGLILWALSPAHRYIGVSAFSHPLPLTLGWHHFWMAPKRLFFGVTKWFRNQKKGHADESVSVLPPTHVFRRIALLIQKKSSHVTVTWPPRDRSVTRLLLYVNLVLIFSCFQPEPHHEMPQASSAHDNLYDFVTQQTETTHMMWVKRQYSRSTVR